MYDFDDSRRPLLVLRARGAMGPAEIQQLRDDLEAVIDRREPFAIVFDMVDVEIPPRDQVMELLAWVRDLRERYVREFDHAVPPIRTFTAYHMPSMLGNLLRFMLQMTPSIRGQQVVCRSFEESLAACEDAIERLRLDRARSRVAG